MYKAEYERISAAQSSALEDTLKIDLKSLLCSSKDGLSEKELKHYYRLMFGKEIPYIILGYVNLYDMMRNLTDVCTIREQFGSNTWIYYPVHDQKTLELGMLGYGQVDRNKS